MTPTDKIKPSLPHIKGQGHGIFTKRVNKTRAEVLMLYGLRKCIVVVKCLQSNLLYLAGYFFNSVQVAMRTLVDNPTKEC